MTATPEAIDLARTAARAADDKFADDIVALDVSQHLALTDIFLIASAPTERQVHAVVDAVTDACLAAGVKPKRREGERENRWVLVDFGDIVLHVQHAEDREFYDLERLWKDCPAVDLQLPEHPEGRSEAAAAQDEAEQRPWWIPAEDDASSS
ncbi:ribosome silencing factor [Kytococcus sedentarius]|uniref:Ribosomal silencing factor RsfS n=1 Tax=Kytococcus sedentarius (strain ATCC 14392 / DSM 20547 / JCM 11482 / CCUG 33030 / NBRC 15357 / NCTC 11040 / CCM 314 / 541) TaxID=478801 RepID=C7NH29_KYTSD|nr:ribosome silencing factor [Kytococcus sedentarius]ACV06199.1 iojap-related protein [Kytococcus sedentarius DSM 20547]OLT36550.1 ribosome silencing factor [Kytococcus sp. CUA-901]QQB64548.1 ribosome silencing factor [Kytococcus sedentarius]STX12380.1 ribosome-associated protein [Kytococcus sedentarius]